MSEEFDYTTPFFYSVEHDESDDCWCKPEIVEIGDMATLVQHNRGVC